LLLERKYQADRVCVGWHPLCFSPSRNMLNTAKKILIADSDEAFRDSLREFIKGLGHEVFEATTGPEVIDRASSIRPDLIMMDLRLPGMNGDEATVRLKANMSTRNIPVVINTGWTTACNVEERADRALNAGAAEVLYKPFHFPLLRDVLRNHLLAYNKITNNQESKPGSG
jgi:two-component system, cell cycle response regulator DivK